MEIDVVYQVFVVNQFLSFVLAQLLPEMPKCLVGTQRELSCFAFANHHPDAIVLLFKVGAVVIRCHFNTLLRRRIVEVGLEKLDCLVTTLVDQVILSESAAMD